MSAVAFRFVIAFVLWVLPGLIFGALAILPERLLGLASAATFPAPTPINAGLFFLLVFVVAGECQSWLVRFLGTSPDSEPAIRKRFSLPASVPRVAVHRGRQLQGPYLLLGPLKPATLVISESVLAAHDDAVVTLLVAAKLRLRFRLLMLRSLGLLLLGAGLAVAAGQERSLLLGVILGAIGWWGVSRFMRPPSVDTLQGWPASFGPPLWVV